MKDEETNQIEEKKSAKKAKPSSAKKNKKKQSKLDYNPPFEEKIIALVLLIATVLISLVVMKLNK
jgi:hypothetical protein